MSKTLTTWIVVLGVLALGIIWGIGRYNAIITAEEEVNTAWAQVQTKHTKCGSDQPNSCCIDCSICSRGKDCSSSFILLFICSLQRLPIDPSWV